MPPLLRAEEITVSFGRRRALDGVSLTAEAGRVTGLIGPNGAGKSTLFDVVCGLRRPRTGRIRLDGRDITREGPPVAPAVGCPAPSSTWSSSAVSP
ncbi:ATP-binding cassette domain-containing protein [Streptomyces sp. Li-HN-5-11]|uniref:ATP-binding cassette domain-containing protein n=1 Tax=Streptomyces sp. Li-HN-5-11 TaxID=3075432 RepID=UPI0028ADA20E|nr:ATP-binding cassette domain-containing protein [Streptomyces sp. Li-HN-5-11]WNM31801.1 ATP-binding cassette domain-containing protein [Streptomyces sp. Li-HN-5-11]